MLNKKRMVLGFPYVKEPKQICEECYKAKHARKAFKRDLPIRSRQKLELVHSDVCGPFEVKSNGGNRYFLTLIDEFTRHMWIYLIERKSEVFRQFKKFKLHAEK